jgi:hypothetical protein
VLYAICLKAKLDLASTTRDPLIASQSFYSASTVIREALLSSIKMHTINGARCAALRLVLQDCLRLEQIQGNVFDEMRSKENYKDKALSNFEELEENMRELKVD